MRRDHRPLLPQLLVLLREDEERLEEPAPSDEDEARTRHVHGLRRGQRVREAG